MMIPNRPALGLLACLRAGVVTCAIGLAGVALAAYFPGVWWPGGVTGERVGWFLIGLGGAWGFVVFAGVLADGIMTEHARIDRQDRLNEEKQELEIDRRRAELDLLTAAPPETAPVKSDRRATALVVGRFFAAGNTLGFTFDGLHDAGVLEYPAYARLRDFYLAWPEAGPVLVWRGGSAPTEWGPTWTLQRVLDLLAMTELPLLSGAPPVVNGGWTAKQNINKGKNTKRGAAGVVVEGVIAGEG